MFVRWQQRKRGRTYWSGFHPAHAGDALVATLIKSVRIDGKPRQQVIAYLGTARTEGHQIHFWQDVLKRLDGVELTPEDRGKAVEQIAAKVGWLTREQVQGHITALIELWGAQASEYVKPSEFEPLREAIR